MTDMWMVSSGIQGRVLKAEMDGGQRFFMKGCNLGRNDEVLVTSALDKVMHKRFHSPLSIRWEDRWILLEDYEN